MYDVFIKRKDDVMTRFFNLSDRFALHAPRVAPAQPAAARDVPQHVRDEYIPNPAVIAARQNDARARIAALLD